MDNLKHQKLFNAQNINCEKDKISNLPDCILEHILSFLPTKDAVGTCILSTRWKNVWTFIPNFDFDDSLLYSNGVTSWFKYPPEVTCFMNFVERILLLRHGSNMEKFRLSCRISFSAARVHSWVSAAIMHNVQELDLCLFVEKPFLLPCCVFNCRTLTLFKIEMNCILELPACISFPCLKILHLCLVTFPDDKSTQNLFSNCPALQDLAILDCEWMNLRSITISIPTLKSLTIDDLPYYGSAEDPHGCEIKIDAASLTALKYIGYLSNEISLCNLSALVSAYIHIPNLFEMRKEISRRALNLLTGLQNVNSARISNTTIESLFFADNVLDHLPVYRNLTRVELNMEIEDHTIGPFMELLQCLPNLEILSFVEGLNPRRSLGEDDWKLIPVAECFLFCLKTINLHNFHGNDAEICMLNFLLRNVLVLQKMNIFWSKNSSVEPRKQQDVKNQLQMAFRGSACCIITFL